MRNCNVLVSLLLFLAAGQCVNATWNFQVPGQGGFKFGGQRGRNFPGLGRFPKQRDFPRLSGNAQEGFGANGFFKGWNWDTSSIFPQPGNAPQQGNSAGGLKEGFYSSACPNAEKIVRDTVQARFSKDRTVAAGILRLFFHDCFVRGCDASILLHKMPSGESTEKFAFANGFTLHGQDVIDAAKAALEAACPGVVSCADILSFATRDVAVMAGLQDFPMVGGRRDGTVSLASEVPQNLPDPISNVDKMTQIFNQRGFSQEELVVLLGAHSVGGAHCFTFVNRLYNVTDPALNANMAQQLKSVCPDGAHSDVTKDAKVDFDPVSPSILDTSYYKLVQNGRGLLTSDNALMADGNTRAMVAGMAADPEGWKAKFSQALVKLSKLDVLVGGNGEIRQQCGAVKGGGSGNSQQVPRFPIFGRF